MRIRHASFPALKTLEDFDWTAQPSAEKPLVLHLAQLAWIEEHANVCFLGPLGTGKTHLATALALKACERGHRVAFATAQEWVSRLRHTFATFALRASSTFELSRYMGTSLGMIDRHYGHLARDGREHAIKLLDLFTGAEPDVHAVDAGWTLNEPTVADGENETTR
jgi:KaiC/GvpD/RAD55 family RecA-like ATPase